MKIAQAVLALGLATAVTCASAPSDAATISVPSTGPSVKINGTQVGLGSYGLSGLPGGLQFGNQSVDAVLASLLSNPRTSNVVQTILDLPALANLHLTTPTLNNVLQLIGLLGTQLNTSLANRGIVQLSVNGNSDPNIGFSLSVTNLGLPNDYVIDIPIPLSPNLTGLVTVNSTLGITQTPGGTIAPTTGFGLPFIMTNTIGSGLCDAGVDLANASTTAITSNYSAGPLTIDLSSPAFTGCNPATQIDVIIAFHGTGLTTYSLTGLFTVDQVVPEPASLAILASAFVGLAAARRRAKASL